MEVRAGAGAFHSCIRSFISQTFIRHLLGAWLGGWRQAHSRGRTVPRVILEAHPAPSPPGAPAAPTQPRVRCWASRYPIAVDCVWTLPASPHPTRPTSFMATYRSEQEEGLLGGFLWGLDQGSRRLSETRNPGDSGAAPAGEIHFLKHRLRVTCLV